MPNIKKITIVIHSANVRAAEGHIPQIAAALARGDQAMALLAPRKRLISEDRWEGVGPAPMEDVLERVEYWSEDVPSTPLDPPTWGRDALANQHVSLSDPDTRLFTLNYFETIFVPAITALGLQSSFDWTSSTGSDAYVVRATTTRARRLLPLL